MFDKFFKADKHEHVHHTVVEERRAPLDSTVSLLRSMEQAAERKLIDAIRTEGNQFKCVWLTFALPGKLRQRVVCKFSLNERDYELEFEVDVKRHDSTGSNHQLVARAVHERVTRELASILMLSLFTVPTGRQLTEDLP